MCAVTIPAFLKNLHASRMSEALEGLEKLAVRAHVLAESAPLTAAFPAPAPLTPASVPRASLVVDPPHTWDHPSWRLLGFAIETPHAYSFQFDSQNGGDISRFSAEAHGDLDGDGVLSTFRTGGSIQPGQAAKREILEVSREVE